MSFTVDDFSDLVKIIDTHPEWRERFIKALFPDIDWSQTQTEQSLYEAAEMVKYFEPVNKES